MAKNIIDAREEYLRFGRYLPQIPAQEEKLTATGVVDITNKSVEAGDIYPIVGVNELGYIEECLVVSPSTEFSLILDIDGERAMDKTYQGFCDITQTVEDISAFEERDSDGNPTGKNIVHLTNINFKQSISIFVKNDSGGSITFQNLFCKYKTM